MKRLCFNKWKENLVLNNACNAHPVFIVLFVLLSFFQLPALAQSDSAQVSDTSKKAVVAPIENDSTPKNTSSNSEPQVQKPITNDENGAILQFEFVKQSVEHGPDSTYFNILKITNVNGKVVNGLLKFSVPEGWKVVSGEETKISIQPGQSDYFPFRVSIARNVVGGVTYLINASVTSERKLLSNKEQNSISKSCHVTIPKHRRWDIAPVSNSIYFDRFSEYSILKYRLMNKGNGNEVVKLEMEIGSGLQMFGSIGNRYFSNVLLKPNSDTVISFSIRYLPPDESVFISGNYKSMTVKMTAMVDSVRKSSSVRFKYLESHYRNILTDQLYPLNIEAQVQNLLSESEPRMNFGADGNILFKNDHTLDYYLRLNNIAFSGYSDPLDFFENTFWRYGRFLAHYNAGRWEVSAGNILMNGMSMMGIFGRGVGGSYKINKLHKISASLTTSNDFSVLSGNIQHSTTVKKKIGLNSSLGFILDENNKMNAFGATLMTSIPISRSQKIGVYFSGSQTQHLYNNQSFVDAAGNYVVTNDPGASFFGFRAQVDYSLKLKNVKANVTGFFSSRHFALYNGGRTSIVGSGLYTINKKFSVISGGTFYRQDPLFYFRGVLRPENLYSNGRYFAEFQNRVNSRLVISSGPVFQHTDHRVLKIFNNDSVNTRFSTISPRWIFRARVNNGRTNYFSVYSTIGLTYITHANDSTLGVFNINPRTAYFNSNTGVNIGLKYWGVNVAYFMGLFQTSILSDYLYYGNSRKSIRVMPYYRRYFFNKRLLVSSYNSYFFQSKSSMENIALNGRLTYFFDRGWTLFVDNNLFINSRITTEGIRTFGKAYALSVGFRKSFDIPQPAVKYYDLNVVCFTDYNGNGAMDANERGISDVVITIDKLIVTDSITKLPVKMRGYFVSKELVTDNFGRISYSNIPQGDFDLSVFPLINLKDYFNTMGQKKKFSISSDTTIYIPFVQSYRAEGHVVLKRTDFSSAGSISLANIRITATDSAGNNFTALTSADGSYILYAPKAGKYNLSVNNVFGENFVLQDFDYSVTFNGSKEFNFDFVFVEKKRQMNINGAPVVATEPITTPAPTTTVSAVSTANTSTVSAGQNTKYIIAGKDTLKDAKIVTEAGAKRRDSSMPIGPGITYRVQLVASSKQVPASQFEVAFRNIKNIQEYTEDGIYKYTSGEFESLEDAKKLRAETQAKGYKDAFIVPFFSGTRVKY